MREYTLTELTGNPLAEAAEIQGDGYDWLRPSDALPDDVEAEMAAAFGWDVEATNEETDAHYGATKCDAADLIARHPHLVAATDDQLIDLIGEPSDEPDADEKAAVAAILIAQRLDPDASLMPLLTASVAHEQAKRRA